MEFTLTQAAREEISRHAIQTFPEECCGVILTDHQVRRLNNIQNRLHSLDPESYPRDATIAYTMDVKELESVILEAERAGKKIKAFYHSHPDHEAYFSQEDKAFASPFGEPTFPDSAQVVVSVYRRAVKEIRVYAWSRERKDFVEIPAKQV